jgi:hypothetical protein
MERRAGWEAVTRLSDFTKATTRKSNEIYRGPPRCTIVRIDSEMQQLLALRSCELISNIGRTSVTSNGEIAFVDIKRAIFTEAPVHCASSITTKENMLAGVTRRIPSHCSKTGC